METLRSEIALRLKARRSCAGSASSTSGTPLIEDVRLVVSRPTARDMVAGGADAHAREGDPLIRDG
eukprot:scaffold16032_cov63-Phaeocystis_antarctica.AAC.3